MLGSVRIGVGHVVVDPGKLTYPPHCHSAEEELFVVLEGSGTLLLGDDERHPVRPGSVLVRPPATRVAHAFRAGDGGLALLAAPATRTTSPSSRARGKVSLRGIGVRFRVDRLGYWDGEPD